MLAAPQAFALSSAVTGLDVLRVPVGARPIGMGTAFSGLADDVHSIAYNPAGLASLGDVQAAFVHAQGLADFRTEFAAIGFPSESWGRFGVEAIYRASSEIRNPGASDNTVRAFDVVVAVAWAGSLERLGGEAKALRAGIAGRLVYSAIGNLSELEPMLDAGLLYAPSDTGYRLGLSVQHLGGKVTFQKEPDTLPITFRLGTAYVFGGAKWHKLILGAEFSHVYLEGATRLSIGAEYVLRRLLSLRAGYTAYSNVRAVQGTSFGAGLKFGIYRFDYAYQPLVFQGFTGGAAHTFGLSFVY